MEMMKRMLALLLVFAMLMPNLTTIAQAADTEDISVISTEPAVAAEETEPPVTETEAPVEETESPAEETDPPAEVTEAPVEETEPPVEETEAPTEETEVSTEETEAPVIQETVTVEETVTEPAANEQAEEELLTETVTVEEQILPDSGYSNDDMFAMYVDRRLYPNKPFTLSTAGFDSLTSKNQNLYTALAGMAAGLAAEGGSSIYAPASEELSDMGFRLTMSVQEVAGTNSISAITDAHKAKIREILDLNLDAVITALLTDLPFDMYWYDKTVNTSFVYSIGYSGGTFTVSNVVITFHVVSAYRDGSNTTVSSTAAGAASAVVAAAGAIVEEHEGNSDLEKLTAYKNYICDQVVYNEAAAKPNYNGGYGDPWQIIYVFDGDPNTNVVCEGYAKAFQYLCDLSDFEGDVESFLVSGYAGGPHMWNIVSIDGRNYLVDVTNSDPAENGKISFGQENDLLFLAGTSGSIDEGYTFYNDKFSNPALTYLYSYEVTYTNGTTEIKHPAIDIYGEDEDSILNLSDISYAEYLEQQEQEQQPEEPVEQEPYISLRWLDWGNGWFENQDRGFHQGLGIAPGEQHYLIAYLNQWNEDWMDWEVTPIHANKLVVDGNLVLEPFRNITDGSNHTEANENFDCFFRISAAEGVMDLESHIAYSNTDIRLPVSIGRYAGGFYSENPVGQDANSLWIKEFRVDGSNRSFWFWYDPSQDYEEGWKVANLKVTADREIGEAVRVEKVTDNLYTITIADETVQNIYSLRDFWLNLEYTLIKDEHSREEHANLNCRATEFGEPKAAFNIDGVRYHASYNYDGLFRYEGEQGEEYPVPVEVEGVSYDIHTNTLTLNGAKLNTLHVTNHWWDDSNGNEGWDLPHGQLTLNLVGENSISATNDHALLVNGDIHLIINGDGTLNVSTTGDENNTCPSAIEANEANITISESATVDVSATGVAYNPHEGRYTSMTPIRGVNGSERCLRLVDEARLTTHVPENACINGHFDADGQFVEEGGFVGIDFAHIEINDNAILNTQTIRVWDEGRGNAYGGYHQNGGTVTITGLPHYNDDYVSEDSGVAGHYHFSGVEADYGMIEINGGELNIRMSATEAQKAKNVYYHGLQSRGRRIEMNGGVVNISGDFPGTGIKVGEDDWDGGTNAWVNYNGTVLNMSSTGRVIDVAPNGSINFNGGVINTYRADIVNRGKLYWYGTELNATESGLLIVEGSHGEIHGGRLHIENSRLVVDNIYDQNGQSTQPGSLIVYGGEVTLDNSFATVAGELYLEGGAILQSLDFRKLTTSDDFAQAFLITPDGRLEISGEGYLEITGMDKVDGLCNEGVLHQKGGTVVIAADQKTKDTAALYGHGRNQFENGYTYLEGYYAAVLFNREDAGLYVSNYATVDAFGKEAGIQTFAPVELSGGQLTAFAACAADPANDIYPVAFYAENNDKGTDARLNISGGSHYFACFENEKLVEGSRGLWLVNAPITLDGGELDVEAAAVLVAAEDAAIQVSEFISNETGASLTLTYHEDLKAKTLLEGDKYARSVAFRTSRNCGENVTWKLESGVLTISGTGAMDDYHMPINDPESWRIAPWYILRDSITKVVVEEGVTEIGYWAFGRLPNVTEIVYPSTVKKIHLESSYACPKLEKFTVAKDNPVYSTADDGKVLIENGNTVLAAVKSINSYTAGDEITTIGMGAFDSTDLESLNLNKVQVIQNYAFADCYNLKEVVIPEGVSTIEMTVFQNSGLESITIPASVGKIRNYAFDGCSDLANVYFTGSESQWNAITIGSGNNALLYAPITFLGTSEETVGDPYLSYRMLTFGGQGYYEDLEKEGKELTIPVGFYPALVVYCNYWNPEAKTWERFAVDPEQLYAVDADGNRVEDLEIGPFRYYEGIGIEEGEPNGYNFFEMAFHSGWGSYRDLCLNVGPDEVAKLRVNLARGNVGFYSEDPTINPEKRDENWLNYYPINPNVTGGHTVYFALTEHPSDFEYVHVGSDRLTPEDLALVKVEMVENKPSIYRITLPDAVAEKVYDYRGIPLKISYKIKAYEVLPEEEGTVEFVFGSVSFGGPCVSFGIDGVWYEAYEGLKGYFSWDEVNQQRLAYKELPGGMTYDYENAVLTMNNSDIGYLHLQHRWYNDQNGQSGTSMPEKVTLNLIGTNTITNPGSESALYVGGGLELTITGDASSSLKISATNADARQNQYSQNAVGVDDDATLIIAGNTTVTTSMSRPEFLQDAYMMHMWGGGNNTLVIKENAKLITETPVGARDNGFDGISWFGEIRVEDNAALTTSTLGLGKYYDERENFRGSGSFVQTGGTTTIEALGHRNENGRINYRGFTIGDDTAAFIRGGRLIIQTKDPVDPETYDWFNGIQVNGHLEIGPEPVENPSGEPLDVQALVEIRIPNNGTGLSISGTDTHIWDGAKVQITGNGEDNHAVIVDDDGDLQVHGGEMVIDGARITIGTEDHGNGRMEIHNGNLKVSVDDTDHYGMGIKNDSSFTLHNGTVSIDKEGNGETVWVRGNMDLNGGNMTVTGNNALSVRDGGCLNQNGAELTVNGLEGSLSADNYGSIFLNGGNTYVTMGGNNETISGWYSTVYIGWDGYLEVNDGFHRFDVAGTPGTDENNNDIWLTALDVRGHVCFYGGQVELYAGKNGQALWNRETGEPTIGFEDGMGAIAMADGARLDLQDRGEGSFSLGRDADDFVFSAKVQQIAAGPNASWSIEKDGDNTILRISGNEDMYNYYMPENDGDWHRTPWDEYKNQITHVIVEPGINHIGEWVFSRMTNLVNVKLPDSVNYISTSAFYGCNKLESFTMQGNDNYNLDDNTCGEPDEEGYRTGSVILEGGWKVLKAAPASDLTTYAVPHFIGEIGNGAFRNCKNLKEVTFSLHADGYRSIWSIANSAFENTGLTKIDLPEGITVIGRSAFEGCSAAAEIVLPESLNVIRSYAFDRCGNAETTVSFRGNESRWNQISGHEQLQNVLFLGQEAVAGPDYLSWRWLGIDENGWNEDSGNAKSELSMPAGMITYGVFYYNHWDEEQKQWTAEAVVPTPAEGSGIDIQVIAEMDETTLADYGWKIPADEPNGSKFVMMTIAPGTWDGGAHNYGLLTYQNATMDIVIQRNSKGFYSEPVASNETWLNFYEMNPLKQSNAFYFIVEESDGWTMDANSFRMWNDNGAPGSTFKAYACGNGIFKIVLDPIFLQDAWQYGGSIILRTGYEMVMDDMRWFHQSELELRTMDLGNPDAIIEINDQPYLYFAEQNGWMTYGDAANDWRPGVANLPAGVSYAWNPETGAQTLTLNNAKLNNLSLCHKTADEHGNLFYDLPSDELTIELVGSSVIETGHREALTISGDLNVTVTGSGKLRLHSDNNPWNNDDEGQYAFDTVVVQGNSSLTIAGGEVTAEISGEGYHRGEPAMVAALRSRFDSALAVTGGSLTTVVPGNARDNAPYQADFEDYYSVRAISEFKTITVSGGTLNTQSLYLGEGETYTQTGGTVNITGLGHLSRQWDENGNTYNNYHYNGLQLNKGAAADISGGQLNLNVTPEGWERNSGSYYNGLSVAGGYANISSDAKIHVHGAFDGNAISVGHDYDDNGNRNAYGKLDMTGGTLTLSNEAGYSQMKGLEVDDHCTANITGGMLNLIPGKTERGEPVFGGINNRGYLTIGGNAEVHLNQAVCSSMMQNVPSEVGLTIDGDAQIFVEHDAEGDMFAWDIVPGSRFNFVSGTITATNSAFWIGGRMDIGENAVLDLTDSDFNADGLINLNGTMTMTQNKVVDNKFIGTRSDEWGNTWEEYEYQSRLYVTGTLNLNGGELKLTNVPVNLDGHAVVNQTGTTVTIHNQGEAVQKRRSDAHDGNDWLGSVNIHEDATLNISGGVFTQNNTDMDMGLNVRGALNMRAGELKAVVPGGIAVAARGPVNISGGETNLSGYVGYEQAYEEGFEQGKLTVTGGSLNIDAVNTGIDLYNNMVVTGGNIDIDIAGYTRRFTDEKGILTNLLAGCGIMGYSEDRKISISINGGSLSIDAPVEVPSECNAVSVFGILAGANTTTRFNGGDVSVKAKTALYAESQDNAKHILINNRLQVLSLDTGNTLNISSGIVEVNRDGENFTWYVDTFEEDETWTTPYENMMMADYATNLKIVNKTAGENAFWDMENGVLTIFAPSGKVGAMAKSADWSLVADKITRVIIDPTIETVDASALEMMTNLKSVKVPHGSSAENYAKNEGITVEYFHQPGANGETCIFEGCVLAKFMDIVEDEEMTTNEKVTEVQKIDTEVLKQELENSDHSAAAFENLDNEAKKNETLSVVVKPEEATGTDDHTVIQDILEAPENAAAPTIVGAALNAEAESKEVALVIGNSEQTELPNADQYEKVVRFSMKLTTTTQDVTDAPISELKVPVQITLPLPVGMDVNRLVILHYHEEDAHEEVSFTWKTDEAGVTYVSFWVSGFSDFDMLMLPQKLKVVLDSKTITYGEPVPALTWNVLDEEGHAATLPEGVSVTVDPVAVTKAGNYTITAKVTKAEGVNCNVEVQNGTLTVAKKQFTVKMDDKEMTAGGALPELTYTASSELPEDITIGDYMVLGDIRRAGEYTITADPGEYDNYVVIVKDGKMTVNHQMVTVTMDAKSMKVGEDWPELTYTVTDSEGNVLENHGLDITPKIESFSTNKAGVYTITAFVENHDQIKAKIETATMTVIRDIVVSLKNATMALGEALPTFDFEVPEGVNKEDVKLTFQVTDSNGNPVTKPETVGEYTITATPTEGENPFYNIAVVDGMLIVEDKEIIIFTDTVKHSLLLKDKIQIQYHFNLANTDVEVTKYGALIWTAEEYEAEQEAFAIAKAGNVQYNSDNVYDVTLVKQSGRYRADNVGQKPRELHIEYYAVPYAIVEGEYWYGNADLYSVQQYADDILTKSTNEKSKKTVEALMRFAKHTQLYLANANDTSVFEKIKVFDNVLSKHNLATTVEWTAVDDALLIDQIVVTQPEYSTNFTAWAGTSLLMKDQTGLGFVLKGKFNDDVEVLYWNASDYAKNSAAPVKGTETGVLEKIAYSSSYDQGLKTGISARLSEEEYYVRMYNTSTGEYSEVKADSVVTNLCRIANKYSDGSNDKALNFARAYLKYAATAKEYLGS